MAISPSGPQPWACGADDGRRLFVATLLAREPDSSSRACRCARDWSIARRASQWMGLHCQSHRARSEGQLAALGRILLQAARQRCSLKHRHQFLVLLCGLGSGDVV